MKSLFTRAHPLAMAAGLAIAVGACDEKLDSGVACPALCPNQQLTVRDTTYFPVLLDSSVAAFPLQGSETEFFIASLGDTLETVAVVRYDSLPTTFRYSPTAEDSLIYAVDSANIRILLARGDTLGPPVTLEVYSVDLGGPDDTDPDLAATAFTPERLIGTRTVPSDSLRDTLVVMIDNSVVLSAIQAQQLDTAARGLRIGIRVNAAGENKDFFRMLTGENPGAGASLRFRPHVDTEVARMEVIPRSDVPENVFERATMQDYLIVVREPPPPPADVLRVGGIPGRRIYVELDIPAALLDSTNIVRATLELTQRPNPAAPQATDTATVREFQIIASPVVTDLHRRLLFTQRFRQLDTIAVAAADSGLRAFEIINLVRSWRGTRPERTPRVMAFAFPDDKEGNSPRLVDFFSSEAPESVRPRLRIFYLPQPEGGLP